LREHVSPELRRLVVRSSHLDRIHVVDVERRLLALLGEAAVLAPWRDHFRWEAVRIEGLTPTGRATLEALHMNRPLIVAIRREEESRGRHPPPPPAPTKISAL
jgi:hypothetical protein